ncbi:hypothetical protein TSUD_372380 [Trifolium subterraneum]|uniref:Endonuclease/exonuclease/phosphatase domain-containing protein n=1 Tax=Trifolium subterraneum TaxID=3900 RepID=A0A2Z6MA70_TRISU|nr:hypothetical protein TSUD_372380 [Trifolium subterraneum]
MGSKWDIEKFPGSNDFGLWKVKVRAILTQQKCDEALKGVATMPANLLDAEKAEMDGKPMSAIILCLADKVLREVTKEKSAANKSVVEQLTEFNKIIDDLANIDVKIEDEDQTFHLLCALPKSLDNLKDALLYGKEGTITLDEVQSALRTKELAKLRDLRVDDSGEGLSVARGGSENDGRLKGKKNWSKSRATSDGGGKFKCHYCQEPGHFKGDYPRRGGGGNSSAQIAVSDEAYEEGYGSAGALIVTSWEPKMTVLPGEARRWNNTQVATKCSWKGFALQGESHSGNTGLNLWWRNFGLRWSLLLVGLEEDKQSTIALGYLGDREEGDIVGPNKCMAMETLTIGGKVFREYGEVDSGGRSVWCLIMWEQHGEAVQGFDFGGGASRHVLARRAMLAGERGSQQTGPTQTNVASPRESRGPRNGGILSTVRGHSPPLRPATVTQSSSNQGSFIEPPAVSLISNRPILAINNVNSTTTQLTTAPVLNEGNQLDPDDMDTQFPGLPVLMIILSWNCRGLGGPSAIPNLKKLARGHKPDVLFLSETLSHNRHIESIRVLLGFDSCLAIDVEGRSGGLAVFWKDSSKCRVLNYTRNFINMLVEDEQWGEWRLTCYYGYPERSRRRATWDLLRALGNISSIPWCIIGEFSDLLSQADKKVEDEQWGEWRLTCYYGYPERSRRRATWDLLRALGNISSIPWCIIGEFSDLLSQADKKGIHPHPNSLCMGFRQAVSDCDLTDIPIEGHQFTWIKSRGTPHVIEERLDRAMASTSWLQLFPQVRLTNLLASHSDHSPILLQWLGGRENLEVIDRVTRCANKLQRWGKKKRIRFKEEIDECVRRMNELRGNQDEEGSIQYQELSERHATLLIQEEGHWKQRAKMHWLQEGDMNTRFFHMSATVRSKKKKVTKLIADNGTETHTQEELCEVAKSYIDTLFKPRDGDHDPVLNLIQPRVTDDDNLVLTAPITKVEIQQALFQMHPEKSPGPYGFNPAFYQRFWEQCSDDIFSAASTLKVRGENTRRGG